MAIILQDVNAIEHKITAGIIFLFAAPGVIHSIRLKGHTIPMHLKFSEFWIILLNLIRRVCGGLIGFKSVNSQEKVNSPLESAYFPVATCHW